MNPLLQSLNPRQREAVTTTRGPVLVLAGAGSGKTRVIIQRIAYLIEAKQVPAKQILAVTFTNKASREMHERLRELLGESGQGVHLSTFHSLGVRLLRENIEHLGYRPNFVIYDSQDQLSLIRSIMEDHGFDDDGLIDAKGAHFEIGQAKNAGHGPERFLDQQESPRAQTLGKLFREYQNTLKGCNAVDFDDILNLTVELFEKHPEAMRPVQERWRYLMVDEYQDTNRVQYRLLRYLTHFHQNVCVVGDDDQSIYAWRGADVRNILSMEQDYPGLTVVRLEQNYRSTQVILDAANQVISHNAQRMPKRLWSEKPGGALLDWVEAEDEEQELETVVRRIRMQSLRHGRDYGDFAILYRSNFQARAVEEALRDSRIPYRLVGSTSFYERQEIRDALAYLKVVHNSRDEVSLHRVINTPRRGIGKTSLMQANELARTRHATLFEILRKARRYPEIHRDAAASMEAFAWMIDDFRQRFDSQPLGATFRELLEQIGYLRFLEQQKGDVRTRERKLNCVQELLNGVRKYSDEFPQRTLGDYLERVMLFTERDQESENGNNQVTLMTLHSAKGLEFPFVFMIGMAEGIFPSPRTVDSGGEDEERRLCYVGITRAREELTFSMGKERRRYGEALKQQPSRFLLEMAPELFTIPPVGKASEKQKAEQKERSRSDFFLHLKHLKAG